MLGLSERAVAKSFSMLGLYVSLSELLLGVSPRSGVSNRRSAACM